MSFPELPTLTAEKDVTSFERALFQHLNELDCPNEFLDLVYRRYDFSETIDRVHLVVSEPSRQDNPNYGLIRLAGLARELLPPELVEEEKVDLEICTASLGKFQHEWIKQVNWLVKGKKVEEFLDLLQKDEVNDLDIPSWKIVYPSQATTKSADEEVQKVCCLSSVSSLSSLSSE
jgi:hypothetical protein